MKGRLNVVTIHAEGMEAIRVALIVEAISNAYTTKFGTAFIRTHVTSDGLVVSIPLGYNK